MGPSPMLAQAQRRWMVPANLWRKTTVPDGGGGQSVVWVQQPATVDVVLYQPSPAEREAAAQEGVEVTHTGDVPLDVDVRRGDRLVVGGKTVEVVSVVTGTHSSVQHIRGSEEPFDEPN